MKKLNSVEAELNAIRLQIYEETKDMSPSEYLAYIKAQTAPLHDKYGIRPVSSRQDEPGRRQSA
jgi:hypothetical protein